MAKRIKKARKETVMRAINGIKGHLDNHPNDSQSVNHLAKLEAKLANL